MLVDWQAVKGRWVNYFDEFLNVGEEAGRQLLW